LQKITLALESCGVIIIEVKVSRKK